MSGGVDSSVTATLMKRSGYDCIGMNLHFWKDEEVQNKCCYIAAVDDARKVCEKIGIPFHILNLEEKFKENIVDYFLDTYAKGKTPNPCVVCNKKIKFGALLEKALELGADYLATGHYAKVVFNEKEGVYELRMAAAKNKDQSYFLYRLTQDQLRHILFPLGEFEGKDKTYKLAKEFGLPRVIEKPESQGVCFFTEDTPKNFLQKFLGEKYFKSGPIITVDGRKIGSHKGLPLYTIGQRQGLGIGGIKGEEEGEPWYVVDIDVEKNTLIVGRKEDTECAEFICNDLSFCSGDKIEKDKEVMIRVRHRGKLVSGKVDVGVDGNATVSAVDKPFYSVSCGQSAVFYEGEKVLGGGIIEKRVK